MKNTSRRDFIKSSSAIGSFFILPSGLMAKAPNSKICTAHIGTGGKGRVDTMYLAKHSNVEVIGLCDVDYAHGKIDTWSKQFKSATAFQDYREMLAKLDDKIDVVSISTPDHTHYPATMDAMERGKHIYLQKPLTHKLKEARQLGRICQGKRINHPNGYPESVT